MLLASNFGALKGYLIAATCFFGFLIMLSAVWLFGIPGTTPLTGPKGTQPTFKFFTLDDPAASTYDSVRDFQGGAGNGWQPAPQREPAATTPGADHEAHRTRPPLTPHPHNPRRRGTGGARFALSPKPPPPGPGLQRPDFAPKTSFAYRDP